MKVNFDLYILVSLCIQSASEKKMSHNFEVVLFEV